MIFSATDLSVTIQSSLEVEHHKDCLFAGSDQLHLISLLNETMMDTTEEAVVDLVEVDESMRDRQR
jgi:hypothetical protein